MGGDVAEPPSWPRPGPLTLLVATACVAVALKVAADAGALLPRAAPFWILGLAALLLTLRVDAREGWLDGWRLLLVLVAAW